MSLWRFLLISILFISGCIDVSEQTEVYSKVKTQPVMQLEYSTYIYINIFRERENLSKLVLDPILSEIARNYSKIMAKKQFFSHFYNGKSVKDRVGNYGYFGLGENLAEISGKCYDIDIAGKVVELWAKSASHRYVMSNKEFNRVGVGIYCENGKNYITTIYAKTCFNKNISLFSNKLVLIKPQPQPNTSKVILLNTTGNCEFKLYVFPESKRDNYFFFEEPHTIFKKYTLPIEIALESPFDCQINLKMCYVNDLE